MTALHPAIEFLTAAALLVGAFFLLVGAIGLARFRDVYMRLHGPTKASTLGLGGVLVASMLWHLGQGRWALPELLISLFVFITAPVSAQLLAQAALHLRAPSTAPLPQDDDSPSAPTDAGAAR